MNFGAKAMSLKPFKTWLKERSRAVMVACFTVWIDVLQYKNSWNLALASKQDHPFGLKQHNLGRVVDSLVWGRILTTLNAILEQG